MFVNTSLRCFGVVKFEARLEDGTLVGSSDGAEFTVKEGKWFLTSPCLVLR